MKKLTPTFQFDNVLQLTPDWLAGHGVRGLIVDMDNTIAPHNENTVLPGLECWLASLSAAGISFTVLSNNDEGRVKPLADRLHIGYVHSAGKPRRRGYFAAMQRMGTRPENTLMAGDQLFTDIWGAARAGLRTVLVKPIAEKENAFIKLKRLLERPFLRGGKGETQ